MMLGIREYFPYWECCQCGCLSLAESPENLGQYYPRTYYSLQSRPPNWVTKLRDRIYLSRVSLLVNWRKRTDLDVIRRLGLSKNMRLLDVGCGSGHLVGDLRELGYAARGLDPWVPHDIHDRFGLRVECKMLSDVQDIYDVILFRHSLEHMPIDSLRIARSRIQSRGQCVVCMPVIGWAWHHYRADWVQLDAPRHVVLHTIKSFDILAAQSGFRVERIVFDSSEFQFWASESYRRNIPLTQATPPNLAEVIRLRMRARSLNRRGQGDTAQFYLRPEN